ncbi:MAG: hypothetical protein AB4041_03620 [Microcystaceae cyanobacterium]
MKIAFLSLAIILTIESLFLMPWGKVEGKPPVSSMEALVLPWDDSTEGSTNLSYLNHKPAGKFGYIEVKTDGHLYAGNQRIRFLGTNMIFSANLPSKADAPKIAARLAKFGINVVRFHHFARFEFPRGILKAGSDGYEFDSQGLDRLDYFIAQLKQQGIYANLNLLTSRRFIPKDNLPTEIGQLPMPANRLLGFFYEPALTWQKEYAQRLLTHRNPYTQLSYTEDPSIAFVEIINEHGLLNYWFKSRLKPQLQDLPAVFADVLTRQWNSWLIQKYSSSENLLARWSNTEGLLEDNQIRLISVDQFKDLPEPMQHDWIEFLYDTELNYYRQMKTYLKDELGVKALLMGTTCASSTMTIQQELDVIDNHVYWDNPKFRNRQWDWKGLDWSISNKSHVNTNPGGRLRWLSMYRVAGKPYSVTEFNHAAPNVFAGEAPLYLASYAALQDWDAIYLFAYEHKADWDNQQIMGLNISQHPTKMVNLPVAAAMFRREDIQPAQQLISASISKEKELGIMQERGKAWNLANGFHLGLKGDDVVRHRLAIDVSSSEEDNPSAKNDINQPFVSDTGELIWDNTETENPVMIVNTPRTKSVFGMTAQRSLNLDDVSIKVGSTLDGGATVSLTLLEGESFSHPKRGLLVATGRAVNTGMKFREIDVPDKKETRFELEDWGTAPTLVETVPAEITVPSVGKKVSVFSLDERGQRIQSIPVKSVSEDRVSFDIGNAQAVLWYEVLWQ